MAVSRQELEVAQAKFNKKYGVDFDIDEFDASISGLAEIGGIDNADQMYKMKFTELYKKAFENFVDRKIDGTFDFMEMINDFDKNIMEPYRNGEGKKAPKPYGGWKVSGYLASVDTYLNDMPLLKPLYAGQRYREGKLGTSDMRAYVNGLKKKDNVTPGELSTVDCYISALSEANENRSLIAKILNPIGLIIEKIHLWLFKSYLEKQTGGPLPALGQDGNEKYKEIYEISNDTLIAKARATVGNAKELALSNEQTREAAKSQKEQVKIPASEITDEQIKTFDQIVYEDPHKENSLDF
jgi:hypothetical protein